MPSPVTLRVARRAVAAAGPVLFLLSAAMAQQAAEPQDAHRVTLRYQSGTFTVQGFTALRTVLPPADELPAAPESLSGFWYELRAADDSLRYRRVIGDPVRLVFEGADEFAAAGEPAPLFRDEQLGTSRALRLLVPRAQDGDRLVIFSSPLGRGLQDQAAVEMARIVLDVP